MLEVIEGKPPLPRWFPPYEHGLFATAPQTGWEASPHGRRRRATSPNPTLVNNVETLANVPHILARGAEWFRSMGTAESPGTVVATVVGDVVAPDVGEVELGTPLRAVIDAVGSGVAPGRAVKAVFSGCRQPGRHRRRPRRAGQLRGLRRRSAAGWARPGSSSTTTPPAWSTPPTGSRGSCRSSRAASARRASSARARSPTTSSGSRPAPATTTTSRSSRHWLERVTDGNRCYLAVEEQLVVSSVLRAFPEEFAEHIELGRCPRPAHAADPQARRPRRRRATYDETFWRKRPDWTYDND